MGSTFQVNTSADYAVGIASQAATCADSNDGATNLQITDGQPPYLVNWDAGTTGENLTNLSLGAYNYSVTSGATEIIAPDDVTYIT